MWGDPHIHTLDGRVYTFNGNGEYTFVSVNGVFELQARMQPVNMAATQLTACAMAASSDGTRIEVGHLQAYIIMNFDGY